MFTFSKTINFGKLRPNYVQLVMTIMEIHRKSLHQNYTTLSSKQKKFHPRSVPHISPHDTTPSPVKAIKRANFDVYIF